MVLGVETIAGQEQRKAKVNSWGTLRSELVGAKQAVAALRVENEALKKIVEEEKSRLKEVWEVNCEFLAEHDQLKILRLSALSGSCGHVGKAEVYRQETQGLIRNSRFLGSALLLRWYQ